MQGLFDLGVGHINVVLDPESDSGSVGGPLCADFGHLHIQIMVQFGLDQVFEVVQVVF
jgi:hypothetical protein